MPAADFRAELRRSWRALLATSLGLGSGMALHPFVLNVLAPHLVEGMGWSRADFALAGMAAGLAVFSYPLVGRLADRFGVRRIGSIGVAATVCSYLAIAALNGPLGWYVGILALQLTLGAMTTGPVFLRLVVRNFDRSRGLALAIAVSTPAVVAALGSPLLAALIEAADWRTGSVAVAIYCGVTGCAALLLVPDPAPVAEGAPAAADEAAVDTGGFRALLVDPRYRRLLLVTVLVSMPLVLTSSQLALVLVDNGMGMALAGSVAGLFPAGTIAGRLLAGLALDRYSARVVGAVGLALPALGMLLIVSPLDSVAALSTAVLLMGLAFGAEGDILAYITSRYFDLDNYGTALGTLFAAVGASAMLSAPLLSLSLGQGAGYTGFLLVASCSVLVGSAVLLGLRGEVRR
ncbi:MFS transporter [Mangrovimicrobium sediminis]|uniref:MFS transporter n=1 Tax=Mangrovimicrobium sediminis TaxID=2562682 RepID=A0A4Z0M0F9_9GAMM|nr:MFS transporter [Haliea sp. SAOS-164]TGD73021.1 MFS transporter [Haliea sp. SAOS-164]